MAVNSLAKDKPGDISLLLTSNNENCVKDSEEHAKWIQKPKENKIRVDNMITETPRQAPLSE